MTKPGEASLEDWLAESFGAKEEPPPLVEPPEPTFGPPTVALGESFTPTVAAEAPTVALADPLVSESSTAPPDLPTEVFAAPAGGALDDLFGEQQFRDYEAEPIASENPFAARRTTEATAQGAEGGVSSTQKKLMWAAGAVVAVLALVALFMVGTKMPGLVGSPQASGIGAEDTADTVGPLPPGQYSWDLLRGGECLDSYSGAWSDTFPVVDCGTDHSAQLVHRGIVPLPETGADSFPGVAALDAQLQPLCAAATVLDYEAAGAYSDIQVETSFPATEQAWNEGRRDFHCFVSRASGEPISGSLAAQPDAED
ncbi:septum formation family protein [Cryobacterium sp. BB736]|uniref:septum formation family protein n=1 Tax=Cryobacterium sp. BB736 TaxID=2746963 RepID=UPI00187356C4